MSGWQLLLGRGSLRGMTMSSNPYHGFRFPHGVIQHAVWLYHCFSVSLRDVELILAARGIVVSYESIREWGLRCGRIFANMLRRRRPRPGDKWYMDEVFIRIRGKQHYLWRAVDQDGNVLDILVQSRRSATAAKRFFRKLLKGLRYIPRVIVTDKLKSYATAKRKILPSVEHRQSRYLNNRAEVSHQPTRRRERQMKRFKSARATVLSATVLFGIGLAMPVHSADPDTAMDQLKTATPIKHVIVVIGENRTFDHIYGTYVPKSGDRPTRPSRR